MTKHAGSVPGISVIRFFRDEFRQMGAKAQVAYDPQDRGFVVDWNRPEDLMGIIIKAADLCNDGKPRKGACRLWTLLLVPDMPAACAMRLTGFSLRLCALASLRLFLQPPRSPGTAVRSCTRGSSSLVGCGPTRAASWHTAPSLVARHRDCEAPRATA